LNVEEKEAIEFREEVVNGQAGYRWNPTKVLAPKVFLFSDVDANRIERALEKYEKLLAEWEGDTIAGQFRWLRLVRAQMTTNGNGNGAKP
jgi:hypothetical protein